MFVIMVFGIPLSKAGFKRPKRRWRDDIVGQQGAVWTRTAKDRERWRTLAESCFLQWKDTAQNGIDEKAGMLVMVHMKPGFPPFLLLLSVWNWRPVIERTYS